MIEVYELHHHALEGWCRYRRERGAAPVLLSFDHHTDTRPAFHAAAGSESERKAWVDAFDYRDDASIRLAISRLRHDEQFDLALRSGVVSRVALVTHFTGDGEHAPGIDLASDRSWPPLNQLLNEPETFRPLARGVLEKEWLGERLREARFAPESSPLFIFDLDLDYLLTCDAALPEDGSLFRDLLQRAGCVTVSRERDWLRLLALDREVTPEFLLKQLFGEAAP